MNKLPEKTKTKQGLKVSKRNSSVSISLYQEIKNSFKAVNLFYVLSAVMQVVLGFLVTFAAILNLVRPIWFSGLLSLLGCVVTMLGFYQLYDVLKSTKSTQDLARDAIERAIRSRN
jgi:hypothetical protein